jgi:hypothetical protein
MAAHRERFEENSARYARFRPQYPDEIVHASADRIVNAQAPPSLPVLDIGRALVNSPANLPPICRLKPWSSGSNRL